MVYRDPPSTYIPIRGPLLRWDRRGRGSGGRVRCCAGRPSDLGSPIVTGLFGPGWLFPGTPPPQEIQPHTTETLRPQAGHGPGNFVVGTTKTLWWLLWWLLVQVCTSNHHRTHHKSFRSWLKVRTKSSVAVAVVVASTRLY